MNLVTVLLRSTAAEPDAPAFIDGDRTVYLFHHIDGMYSFCTDDRGVVYHFAAWTEVSKLKE